MLWTSTFLVQSTSNSSGFMLRVRCDVVILCSTCLSAYPIQFSFVWYFLGFQHLLLWSEFLVDGLDQCGILHGRTTGWETTMFIIFWNCNCFKFFKVDFIYLVGCDFYYLYRFLFQISSMQVISGHLGWVRSLAFDPSNNWFCTGSADRTIKVSMIQFFLLSLVA